MMFAYNNKGGFRAIDCESDCEDGEKAFSSILTDSQICDAFPEYFDCLSCGCYKKITNEIDVNFTSCMQSIENPYTGEESATWPYQLAEAESYILSSSADTPMIDSMVIAAAGEWEKSNLCNTIISRSYTWKTSTGDVLGQLKKKKLQVKTAYAQLLAKEITIDEFTSSINTSFTTPVVSLEEKF